MASELMCPHCGWCYDPQKYAKPGDDGRSFALVPGHDFGKGDGVYPFSCPGSEQCPRNPETDRRPLWKDLPVGHDAGPNPPAPESDPTNGVEVVRCWCGVEGPYDELHDDAVFDQDCGGSGVLYCECGGDLCVCHNHGEVPCPGCDDCDDRRDTDLEFDLGQGDA